MPIIREWFSEGDFVHKEDNGGNRIEYHFFLSKGVGIIIDIDDDETIYVPIRESDDHGLMSWDQQEKCWVALTDDIQRLYQGHIAEQELLK